jgi:hypothetical protein
MGVTRNSYTGEREPEDLSTHLRLSSLRILLLIALVCGSLYCNTDLAFLKTLLFIGVNIFYISLFFKILLLFKSRVTDVTLCRHPCMQVSFSLQTMITAKEITQLEGQAE